MEKIIRLADPVFSAGDEIGVDCEMLLPDYYPEVSKILDCAVSYAEEAVTVTSDRITYSGRARFDLMYLSEQNTLTSYTSIQKFTKNLGGAGFEAGDFCRAEVLPGNLNFKASAPRRVDCHAVATVRVTVIRTADKAVSEPDNEQNVQRRIFKTEVFSPAALTNVTLNLSDRVQLPVPKDKVSGLRALTASAVVREVSCIKNKTLVKGELAVSFDCVDTEGKVYADQRVTLPFSEVKDVFGVDETLEVHAFADAADVDVDLKSVAFADDEAPFTAKIRLMFIAGADGTLEAADDLYVPHGKAEFTRERVGIPVAVTPVKQEIGFTLDADGIDLGVSIARLVETGDVVYKLIPRDGQTVLSGSLRVSALCKLSDGGDYCVSRKKTFETVLPECDENDTAFLTVKAGDVACETRVDALRFSGTVNVEGLVIKRTEKNLVTSVSGVETRTQEYDNLTVYYANAGEDLWEIAKANDARFDLLADLNDELPDVLTEPRVLLLK